MVLKWRRAFCTSVPRDERKDNSHSQPSPAHGLGSRFFGFFSNPSTPRMQSKAPASSPTLRCRAVHTFPAANVSVPGNSAPQSPMLRCKTRESPSFFRRSSAASSPRSPATFSLLNLGIGTSKSRCGICLQKVKSGQGTAIFTAECGHSVHFPCITARVKKQGTITCPICSSTWKEMHLLSSDESNHAGNRVESVARDFKLKNDARCMLKVYNDDEPLSSPTFGARFNPILESDELEEENDEFPGFFVAGDLIPVETKRQNLEISLPEAAVISAVNSGETYAVVLRIKAPTAPVRRAPIDLVTVLNVGRSITTEKIDLMKKAMRLVVSSLSATDRLSIVAFSTASKRLLPLRRMNAAGKRSARRIIDAVVALDTAASCAADSIKKAAKVISDRREKNPTAAIVLLSDGQTNAPFVSSTAFSNGTIPLHSVNLSAPLGNDFLKSISRLFTVVVQDLSIQLSFTPTSTPPEISAPALYSCKNKPSFLGSGSGWCRIGDFHADEEREFLIELKSSSSLRGPQQRVLCIRCSYKDPSTKQSINDNGRSPLPIPHPRDAGCSTRLKCLFLTTRAVAESRRLLESNEVGGAYRMLSSARALVLQTGWGAEFVPRLEAEMVELKNQPQQQQQVRQNNHHDRREAGHVEEKGEALTPTSAWRAAERLAKVAIMRKSLNRVSDLHGFENARF